MKITKAHEGKTIYGVPTGNNARRGVDRQEPETFEVVSVARKYAELRRGSYTDHYCCERGATKQAVQSGYGLNGGYRWYESVDEINDDRKKDSMIDELSSSFRYMNSNNTSLTYDQVKRIHDIVSEVKS